MILLNGENYPVPARKSKVKYPTRPGKKYEIPDPLDTRKFQKMKYPTRSIPGKSLPDPSLWITVTSHPSEINADKIIGVGGLGGLYPALHKLSKCHYNGSIYDNGDIVS